MNLKSRIQQLERQVRVREELQVRERADNRSEEEWWFLSCHGCHPQELDGRVERKVERQYMERALRVTIILEKVDEPEPSTL